MLDGSLPHLVPGRRLGATVRRDGASLPVTSFPVTSFEVWAPDSRSVALHLESPVLSAPDGRVRPLEQTERGVWRVDVAGVGHGDRYRFSLDGGEPLADPASSWQPDGVHGASAVVDTFDFGGHESDGVAWSDQAWRGRPLEGSVIYELHVGAFTPAGTFDAAIGQLDRLAALGITTIELMPVNATPGARNWGYDGVFPFAVHEPYGGPAGLARFVDAAHGRGLAVILDVVYNHLGPEGAVHQRYAPYLTDTYVTPWGGALNVMGHGSDGVRRYVLENVARWVLDYHLDGFRLDAVHAVIDTSANPFWEQVAEVAHAAGRAARRTVVVIAESSDNDPRYVRSPAGGGFGHDGVWNDDLHHTMRVAVTGDRSGYYADYRGTAEELADVLRHRWRFRGQYSTARGRSHGRPADDAAPHRFVVCSQNHDQIGNRPAGERLDHHATAADRRLVTAITLLSPFTPMLFMGEEYGEPAPFPFFVDHQDPAILDATRRGRREEFADADWGGSDGEGGGVPDPGDPATFAAAVLDPRLADREPHRSLLAMYTRLIDLRRTIAPVTSSLAHQRVHVAGDTVQLDRWLPDGAWSTLVVNLGDQRATVEVDASSSHAPVPVSDRRDPDGGRDRDRASRYGVVFDSASTEWGGPGGGVTLTGTTVTVAGRTAGLLASVTLTP